MNYVEKRIEYLEKEIDDLKKLVKNSKKKAVSFSGIARTTLSDKELDEEIRKAKKSAFFHGDI